MDFTKIAPNAKEINLSGTDLSNVTKLNLGNAEEIDLSGTWRLHGELDFTKIAPKAKKINLSKTNLSRVTGIKITDPKIISGVDEKTLQKLILAGATNKIQGKDTQKRVITPRHPLHY